jgi:hypothetical protein
MPQMVDEWFEAYEALRDLPAVKKEAAAIVKPYAETRAKVPPPAAIDWEAFSRDAEATLALFELWNYEMSLLDDDDDVAMLEH